MTLREELLSHSGLRVRAFFNSALAYVYYYNYLWRGVKNTMRPHAGEREERED